MNHQPYETWILDGYEDNPENRELLQIHLRVCTKCAQLHSSWQKAQHQIKNAPIQKAPGNFVTNWQKNLVLFKEKQKRIQARTLLLSFISGALVVLIALGAVLLPKISFISVIVTVTSAAVRLVESIKQIWILIMSLLKVAPTTTIIVIGTMLVGWILLAVLAWAVSVWKVSLKKVVEK
jgi:hypothetical protein